MNPNLARLSAIVDRGLELARSKSMRWVREIDRAEFGAAVLRLEELAAGGPGDMGGTTPAEAREVLSRLARWSGRLPDVRHWLEGVWTVQHDWFENAKLYVQARRIARSHSRFRSMQPVAKARHEMKILQRLIKKNHHPLPNTIHFLDSIGPAQLAEHAEQVWQATTNLFEEAEASVKRGRDLWTDRRGREAAHARRWATPEPLPAAKINLNYLRRHLGIESTRTQMRIRKAELNEIRGGARVSDSLSR